MVKVIFDILEQFVLVVYILNMVYNIVLVVYVLNMVYNIDPWRSILQGNLTAWKLKYFASVDHSLRWKFLADLRHRGGMFEFLTIQYLKVNLTTFVTQ